MKKMMYIGLFSLSLMGVASCSDSAKELDDAEQTTEDAVTPEKTAEMEKAIKTQEEAEKLDKELDEYINSIK